MSNIIVLDFETGGLDPTKHALMSVAAVTLDDRLLPLTEYYQVIQDLPGKIIEADAQAVNGITDEEIKNTGIPVTQVLDDLHIILEGQVVCCHNAAFDVAWLNERGFDIQNAIDTMFLAWQLWPYQKAKLSIVCERAGITVKEAHNSLGDTRMTVNLLRYFSKQLGEKVLEPVPIRWKWWEKGI